MKKAIISAVIIMLSAFAILVVMSSYIATYEKLGNASYVINFLTGCIVGGFSVNIWAIINADRFF